MSDTIPTVTLPAPLPPVPDMPMPPSRIPPKAAPPVRSIFSVDGKTAEVVQRANSVREGLEQALSRGSKLVNTHLEALKALDEEERQIWTNSQIVPLAKYIEALEGLEKLISKFSA